MPSSIDEEEGMASPKLKPAVWTSGHNVVVKVISSNVVVEKPRHDGSIIRVAEAKVGDHTGSITLTARNGQIDAVIPGNTIIIRNAKIDMFKGFMRLVVDKWGLIKPAPPDTPKFEVNVDNDLSGVEYELVTVIDDS